MVSGRTSLGEILIRNGVIEERDLQAALKYGMANGCRVGEALSRLRLCSDLEIAQALAQQLEIRLIDFSETPPRPDAVELIPREVAVEYSVVPVHFEGPRLVVAMRDPFDIRVDDAIREVLGCQIIPAIAPESQLREFFQRTYYSASPTPEAQPSPLPVSETERDVEVTDSQTHDIETLVYHAEQFSSIRIVNTIITDAVEKKASDIHIEPGAEMIRVRYRVDGKLRNAVTMPLAPLESVVARIKIMCGMDIAVSRRPQDGSCRLRIDDRAIEVRASTLPGVHGEIVVMRLLVQDAGLHHLDALGFHPEMLRRFGQVLSDPHGMLLVTGPTGSGKTTTLYASMNRLNTEGVNIISVEDPVEAKVAGLNQVQVEERAGRSFAAVLRAMLRQDPDVIMVGEIRDMETGEIACRAALTGHLVLSTLHTRDSIGALARLIDMGISRDTVTASLNAVIAQRLVPKICEACAEDYLPPMPLQTYLRSRYDARLQASFRRGRGCSACGHTGTRGRIGVYELLVLDDTLKRLVLENASTEQLRTQARAGGFVTLQEDAFLKAAAGLVRPEEVVELESGGHGSGTPDLLYAPA